MWNFRVLINKKIDYKEEIRQILFETLEEAQKKYDEIVEEFEEIKSQRDKKRWNTFRSGYEFVVMDNYSTKEFLKIKLDKYTDEMY